MNVIKDDLINKIDNTRKTAESALQIAKETKEVSEGLKEEFTKVQYLCENLKAENFRLKKTHVNHLDNYSKKSNLVISGLREKDNESMNQCEQLVGNFFS